MNELRGGGAASATSETAGASPEAVIENPADTASQLGGGIDIIPNAASVASGVTPENNETMILFSDLDGTLIHYPDLSSTPANEPMKNDIIRLPPSSTGMQGVISSKTHQMIKDIRKSGTKVVLVSGMRTTTLLSRLPFLPRADAYCSEAGGRIFYATDAPPNKSDFVVKPKRYAGAKHEDLQPFGLKEDAEWRSMMEKRSGKLDGLNLLQQSMKDSSIVSDVCERDGLLWDYARSLMEEGYVLDTKGYSTCFRVNRKQQTEEMEDKFDAMVKSGVKPWGGLTTSTNLGCVDFYPKESGKLKCCQYLSGVFFPKVGAVNDFMASHAVCMCDDDNDLEMAMACRHAYIPEVTSESMARMIQKEASHFTKTCGEETGRRGYRATEAALELILSGIKGVVTSQ